MRLFLLLFVLIVISCKNKNADIQIEQNSFKQKVTSKHPGLFPFNLKLKALSHDLILNINLFEQYNLKKNDTASIKQNVSGNDFNYSKIFYTFVQKSKHQEIKTNSGKDTLKFELSFDCEHCYDAILFRAGMNLKEMVNDTAFNDYLDDPATIDRKIKRKGNRFQITEDFSLNYDGLLGIYLVLRNKNKELFFYEIAGLKSDASSPTFNESEYCEFTGDSTSDGTVCLTTKKFEGNDYTGYDVPIKGYIQGDIKTLLINGKNVSFNKGEFYQRIHINLKTGYNQIPIIIKDKFSNTTETYLKVTLERIKKDPQIIIDNNLNDD